MKLGPKTILIGALGAVVFGTLGVALWGGQTAQQPKPKPRLAGQVFKNVQVLRDVPVNEFMETMGFFCASLNESCVFCHVQESGGSWAKYADDTPMKQKARMMVVMMNSINQSYFGGRREVTCYSCHRGNNRPLVTPTIAGVYGESHLSNEPDELLPNVTDGPSADQILNKYIQARGGAERLNAIKSLVIKGTYQGYAEAEHPVEIYVKAPDQIATIVHTHFGNRTTAFNGREGWVAMPTEDRPVPVAEMTDGDLSGARLDAIVLFSSELKETLKQWRVSYPITLDNRDVEMVQGTIDGRTPVDFYFDKQSGLLVRQERFSDSKVGLYATQINYSDYRPVNGVMMPFHWTVSWLDGQANYVVSDIQVNVAIPPSRFAKPAPPTAPKEAAK